MVTMNGKATLDQAEAPDKAEAPVRINPYAVLATGPKAKSINIEGIIWEQLPSSTVCRREHGIDRMLLLATLAASNVPHVNAKGVAGGRYTQATHFLTRDITQGIRRTQRRIS